MLTHPLLLSMPQNHHTLYLGTYTTSDIDMGLKAKLNLETSIEHVISMNLVSQASQMDHDSIDRLIDIYLVAERWGIPITLDLAIDEIRRSLLRLKTWLTITQTKRILQH